MSCIATNGKYYVKDPSKEIIISIPRESKRTLTFFANKSIRGQL